LEEEEDVDEETMAVLTSQIYSSTFSVAILEATKVPVPTFCKQLATCLEKENLRFNEVRAEYNVLRTVVHDTLKQYDAATRTPSTVDEAVVGPLVGHLLAHETALKNAIVCMSVRRQLKYYAECVKLAKWMEHMHFEVSSPGMKASIRQWRSTVDSLGVDVLVRYKENLGLPMKFSANALALLLDMVVDRLHGTTADGAAGSSRMDRLTAANAPFTGQLECATLRYKECISTVHAGAFALPVPLLEEVQERSSALLSSLATQPILSLPEAVQEKRSSSPLPSLATQPIPPRVPLGASFGVPSAHDKAVSLGMVTVVQTGPSTTPPLPPGPPPALPPGPPPALSLQASPAASISPLHGDEVDYEDDELEE
jgi:hypothetical protein